MDEEVESEDSEEITAVSVESPRRFRSVFENFLRVFSTVSFLAGFGKKNDPTHERESIAYVVQIQK